MPKGDRLKLKADPEDGTTPIANLLLEAVAMAKITGLQKGAVLYLWRRTYGWLENGQRLKERKITLTEWKNALDSSASRLSKALAGLEEHNIIKRRMADAWGGYYYKINTNVSTWNRNCISIPKLAEQIGIKNFATVDQNATVDLDDNSCPKRNATVDQNATQQLTKTQPPTLYKEILNKDINKGGEKLKKFPPQHIELRKQTFSGLQARRGYKSRKPNAEALAISQMLSEGLTVEDILKGYDLIKTQAFFRDKNLSMMQVRNDIHEVLKNGAHQGNNNKTRQSKGDTTEDGSKYITGRYGKLVKR